MGIRKKLVYSIIPSVVVAVIIAHLMTFGGILEIWHVIALNILLLCQVILLYNEMGKTKLTLSSKVLYTLILVSFLPFHYILIWGIMEREKFKEQT